MDDKKRKFILDYLDSSYPDIKLRINRLTDSIIYDNQKGYWYAEKLYLGRLLSDLFSCTPNEAHTTIIKWERSKLVKK
jgi:hypothetical protein